MQMRMWSMTFEAYVGKRVSCQWEMLFRLRRLFYDTTKLLEIFYIYIIKNRWRSSFLKIYLHRLPPPLVKIFTSLDQVLLRHVGVRKINGKRLSLFLGGQRWILQLNPRRRAPGVSRRRWQWIDYTRRCDVDELDERVERAWVQNFDWGGEKTGKVDETREDSIWCGSKNECRVF